LKVFFKESKKLKKKGRRKEGALTFFLKMRVAVNLSRFWFGIYDYT
jgi:hypothetical protein